MADGTYERRGPREAELKRLQRIIAEARAADRPVKTADGDRPAGTTSDGATGILV